MAARRGEGHLLLLAAPGLGPLQTVEPAVEGEYAPAGGGAELDAELLECRVDAERAELGVLLQAPHRVDGPEVHLAHALRATAGPVLEPIRALRDPPA